MPVEERRRSKRRRRLAGLIIGLIGVVGCSFVWLMSNWSHEFSLFWYYGPVTPIDWVIVLAPPLFLALGLVIIAQKWELIGGTVLILQGA